MEKLGVRVFPSKETTISVAKDDTYGGAHTYKAKHSLGFNNGVTEYIDTTSTIQFVKKEADGSMTSGLQSEQLAYILLDRCEKLNAVYPSKQNKKMIKGLNMFLDACRERVEDRMNRDVMGKLEK